MMENTILELEQLLEKYLPALRAIAEEELIYKPSPGKWSSKEILGHLIDSAQNNIRRFVVATYEEKPLIKYAQDNWVSAANYQTYHTAHLITLWELLNRHICVLLKNMPAAATSRVCDTGELHTIEWLAADYNKHLLHHLHQVLKLEPIAYPC